VTHPGLRLNQAAAAYCALTSPRRGAVIIAAADAGKTYAAAAKARPWQADGNAGAEMTCTDGTGAGHPRQTRRGTDG
jgi:hypothetical protein